MASKSYPRAGYNSGSITSAEHERLVQPHMADGIFGHPAEPGPVIADSTSTLVVKIRAGTVGYLRGSVYESGPTDVPLPALPANTSGQPRIDLIVLRLNRSDYSVTETAIIGIPGANPSAPGWQSSTGSTGFFDLPLAEVLVAHNAGALADGHITTRCWYVGSNGQIRCTPTTRPSNEAGLAVWEHPAGVWMLSTGGRWIPAADEWGSSSVQLASGWGSSSNRLFRRNGWVHGTLSPQRTGANIAAGATVTVGTIPLGYRPPYDFEHIGFTTSTNTSVIFDIKANGQVIVRVWGGLNTSRYMNMAATSWPAA